MNENIKIIANKSDIDAIADAVRNKTGGTELMSIHEIAIEINGIETGSGGGVTVPELKTFDFETTDYPVIINYLTIDENNSLCRETVYGSSGSFSAVPDSWIHLETIMVEIDSSWGVEDYYPHIQSINNDLVYVSTNGADHSMCSYQITNWTDSHLVIDVT